MPCWEYIQPVLHKLHWLPMGYWIQFKILAFTVKILKDWDSHTYKTIFPGTPPPQQDLFMEDKNLLVVPSLRGVQLSSNRARVFSAVSSTWWNCLPDDIRALALCFLLPLPLSIFFKWQDILKKSPLEMLIWLYCFLYTLLCAALSSKQGRAVLKSRGRQEGR